MKVSKIYAKLKNDELNEIMPCGQESAGTLLPHAPVIAPSLLNCSIAHTCMQCIILVELVILTSKMRRIPANYFYFYV